MRAYVLLAALLAAKIAAHPLCFIDDKPTDYEEVLTFCPEAQAGACCTDLEEAEVEARYDAVSTVPLTGECADLYKQVRTRRVWSGFSLFVFLFSVSCAGLRG